MDITLNLDHSLKIKKNKLLAAFADICGDEHSKILETKGQYLTHIKVKYSINLYEQLFSSFRNFASEHADLVDSDAELLAVEEALLVSLSIHAQYGKFKSLLLKVKDRIEKQDTPLLTPEELSEAISISLNEETIPTDFYESEDELYRIFIQTYCTNAAIRSGLFVENAIITLEQLEEASPRLAMHAKKTALDQICASVFKSYNPNYDEMVYFETFDNTSDLTHLCSSKMKDNEIAFAYVNVNKMDAVYFPKFVELMDHKTGKTCYVNDVVHQSPELDIPCVIAGVNVQVRMKVNRGLILTTVKEYN